jgi:methyl-accepting chemotaxis protein
MLTILVKKLVVNPLDTTTSILHEIAEGDLKLRVDKLSNDASGSTISLESLTESMNVFDKIQNKITSVAEDVQSINELISIQSKDIGKIILNIDEVATEIDKDTMANANKSEVTLINVKHILKQTSQVEQASKILSHSSKNLNDMVSDFKLK